MTYYNVCYVLYDTCYDWNMNRIQRWLKQADMTGSDAQGESTRDHYPLPISTFPAVRTLGAYAYVLANVDLRNIDPSVLDTCPPKIIEDYWFEREQRGVEHAAVTGLRETSIHITTYQV